MFFPTTKSPIPQIVPSVVWTASDEEHTAPRAVDSPSVLHSTKYF